MKTPELINAKILQLDDWLKANPDHPNYTIVLSDKRNLKNELLKTSM